MFNDYTFPRVFWLVHERKWFVNGFWHCYTPAQSDRVLEPYPVVTQQFSYSNSDLSIFFFLIYSTRNSTKQIYQHEPKKLYDFTNILNWQPFWENFNVFVKVPALLIIIEYWMRQWSNSKNYWKVIFSKFFFRVKKIIHQFCQKSKEKTSDDQKLKHVLGKIPAYGGCIMYGHKNIWEHLVRKRVYFPKE